MIVATRLFRENSRLHAEKDELIVKLLEQGAQVQSLHNEIANLKAQLEAKNSRKHFKQEAHSLLAVCYSSLMLCVAYSVNAWKSNDAFGANLGICGITVLVILSTVLYFGSKR